MTAITGILSVDWFEVAGCIAWTPAARQLFDQLKESQNEALMACKPRACSLGDGQLLVHERGMGTGRASRLEYRLEWCGSTIGLSSREKATRHLSNFYLKIPGECCLLFGFDSVHEKVVQWVSEWGGEIVDEWVRRLDLCFDTVDVDLQETIFPAFANNQFVATAEGSNTHNDGRRVTGVTIGSERGASVTIYDKLTQVKKLRNPIYERAMVEQRWGGVMPAVAARVEYRLRREYLREFGGMKNVADVIGKIAEIVERLVQIEKRPFFKLTDAVPDRVGRNQGKVGILPEWAAIVSAIKAQVGEPLEKLKRLERGLIDARRALSNAIGNLTSASAFRGIYISGLEDLMEFFVELCEEYRVTDNAIKQKWEEKARRCGTFNMDAERDRRVERAALEM